MRRVHWRSVPILAEEHQRIGLFGGTFDPPHVGHLVTAVNVRHALSLDLVILMVANVPWQKEGSRRITPGAGPPGDGGGGRRRRRRTRARQDRDRSGEVRATPPTPSSGWTKEYPDAAFYTIVGDDAAAGLTSWERYQEVVERSSLVVVDRPGARVELPDVVDWIRVEVPRLEVSSTDLRARFTDGRPLDYLVTEPVLDVIAARDLYRGNE